MAAEMKIRDVSKAMETLRKVQNLESEENFKVLSDTFLMLCRYVPESMARQRSLDKLRGTPTNKDIAHAVQH